MAREQVWCQKCAQLRPSLPHCKTCGEKLSPEEKAKAGTTPECPREMHAMMIIARDIADTQCTHCPYCGIELQ